MTDFLPQAIQAGGVLAFAYLIWRQQVKIADAISSICEDIAVIRDRQEREPSERFATGESQKGRERG